MRSGKDFNFINAWLLIKQSILHYLLIVLFYVLFFAIARFIFIYFNSDGTFTLAQALPAFVHGARMDTAISCYFLIPSILLHIGFLFFGNRIFRKIELVFHFILITLSLLIVSSNIALYHFWNSMINFRAISYLADPSEVFTSLSKLQSIFAIAGLIIATIFFCKIFHKFFYLPLESQNNNVVIGVSTIVIISTLTVVGMRGGVQMLPLNESLVYFSKNNFLNQAAVNPAWHLTYDIYTAGLSNKNPFGEIDPYISKTITDKLLNSSYESFPLVLNTDKPNIVFIILESYTADVVASLGGDKRTNPFMEKLIPQGIFFDSIYSTGTRTDQGIVSILNGWPATPYHSIMRSNEKSIRLPSLVKTFAQLKYNTSFYYGGEGNFSNLDAYCVSQKFDKIITRDNGFDKSLSSSRWGVADEFLFSKHQREIQMVKEPFFTTLMTLSNHEPFDVPGQTRIPGKSDADKFRNSAAYTDACMGDYLTEASGKSWYKNTLFIILADHGHRLPKNRLILEPESRRIPLLFFGEVIKPEYRGMKIHTAGGHHDIASTLLYQLALPAQNYRWSKNLLNPHTESYSFYQFEETVGFVQNKKWMVYSYNTKSTINHSRPITQLEKDSLKLKAQCYLQELYKEYQSY